MEEIYITHIPVVFKEYVTGIDGVQPFKCSHLTRSVKKGVLRGVVKFTGKHLCWSLFKLQGFFLSTKDLLLPPGTKRLKIKKETPTLVFS